MTWDPSEPVDIFFMLLYKGGTKEIGMNLYQAVKDGELTIEEAVKRREDGLYRDQIALDLAGQRDLDMISRETFNRALVYLQTPEGFVLVGEFREGGARINEAADTVAGIVGRI
jgi:hypothetical protein